MTVKETVFYAPRNINVSIILFLNEYYLYFCIIVTNTIICSYYSVQLNAFEMHRMQEKVVLGPNLEPKEEEQARMFLQIRRSILKMQVLFKQTTNK